VEFNQTIGNRNLIIRSLAPAVYTSADLLKKTADEVNQVAASLKAHKMRVGYHNHTTDFNRIDGEYWWNRFADRTSKDVILQFDTGNAPEAEVRDAPVIHQAKRGPHDLDAREAVLQEGSERVPWRRRARLAGDHDGRRDRRRHRVVHHQSTKRKACRPSNR